MAKEKKLHSSPPEKCAFGPGPFSPVKLTGIPIFIKLALDNYEKISGRCFQYSFERVSKQAGENAILTEEVINGLRTAQLLLDRSLRLRFVIQPVPLGSVMLTVRHTANGQLAIARYRESNRFFSLSLFFYSIFKLQKLS